MEWGGSGSALLSNINDIFSKYFKSILTVYNNDRKQSLTKVKVNQSNYYFIYDWILFL